MPEKILIIGNGGREHALAWKLGRSSQVSRLFVAPGNSGTSDFNIDIGVHDIDGLADFATRNDIGLTVVGPEAPLASGIVNVFQERGLKIFGPTEIAARLETSKAWSSQFLQRHNIPHPDFHISYDVQDALAFVKSPKWDALVIKADGLASGKGVILPSSKEEAREAVIDIMERKKFGRAGEIVVFQERLIGQEVSVIAFSDGKTIVPLLSAQDHKAINDNDEGPNTGGMGAYAPAPILKPEIMRKVQKMILQQTIDGMRLEGSPYKGILYAGLMITKDGPKVLEYNVRFGDPETQPLMMLLRSDLAPILLSCIEGTLKPDLVKFRPGAAVCVVLAARGYPGTPETGKVIDGLDHVDDSDIQVFHAGAMMRDGHILTNGGRVLGVTAYGKDIGLAIEKAYSAIGDQGIHFEGMHYRRDIGAKAMRRLS